MLCGARPGACRRRVPTASAAFRALCDVASVAASMRGATLALAGSGSACRWFTKVNVRNGWRNVTVVRIQIFEYGEQHTANYLRVVNMLDAHSAFHVLDGQPECEAKHLVTWV